jgi:DNA-binding YbaB/EbfC family protein
MSSDNGEGTGLGDLFAQVQHLQEQLAGAQDAATATVVEGRAGDGSVTVRVTGDLDFQKVIISPALMEGGDVGLLEDLILVALRDAIAKIEAVSQVSVGGLADLLAPGGLASQLGMDNLLGGLASGSDSPTDLLGMIGRQLFAGLDDDDEDDDDEDDDDEDEDDDEEEEEEDGPRGVPAGQGDDPAPELP